LAGVGCIIEETIPGRTIRGDDPWDRVKHIALGGSSYVSFGGELRGSYERYRNYNWGSGRQDPNGYYLNRIIGHADLHLGPRVRVFAEFQSGLEFGRNGGPKPVIDQDKLDVSQLFLELNPSTPKDRPPISLRLGRQELNYGERTLVSTRELNVRRPRFGPKMVGGGMIGPQNTAVKTTLGPLLNGFVNYEYWQPVSKMRFPGVEQFLNTYQARAAGVGVDMVAADLADQAMGVDFIEY
jgi:hypothetical protein